MYFWTFPVRGLRISNKRVQFPLKMQFGDAGIFSIEQCRKIVESAKWEGNFDAHSIWEITKSGSELNRLFFEYEERFGPAYQKRAGEAVNALNARCFMASCAMSGAAAESILLTIAAEMLNSREEAERIYVDGKIKARKFGSGNSCPVRNLFGCIADAAVPRPRCQLPLSPAKAVWSI